MDSSALPAGVSPDCADIEFRPGVPGSVKTRPGLTNTQAPINGATYLTNYTDGQGNDIGVYLDKNGYAYVQYPSGPYSSFLQGVYSGVPAGSYAKSDTAFGSEFMAFSDGKYGLAIPRRVISGATPEDLTADRWSQSGPGAGPTGVADFNFALTAISRTSGVITGTIGVSPAASGLAVGGLVTISGVNGDATLNGQYPVVSITGTTTTTFTAWGFPGVWAVNSLILESNTVTAVLQNTPTFPVGTYIVISNAGNPSFDGYWRVLTISGNILTWVQTAANASAIGATLYTQNASSVLPVLSAENNAGLPGTGVSGFIFTIPYNSQPNLAGFVPGASVTISGNTVADYNTTVTIQYGPQLLSNSGVDYAYGFQALALGAGSGYGTGGSVVLGIPDSSPTVTGVAGPGGNISLGEHQLSVLFITRNGYFTAPAAPIAWTAAGLFMAQVTGIPTGPPNIIARLLVATASGGANYFFSQANGDEITTFLIPDNITTSFMIDFSDLALLSSTSADLLFDRIPLPECAGCLQYSDRMFAWGARNYIQNFVNMDFDGGPGESIFSYPLGWAVDPTSGSGGFVINSDIFGGEYAITTAVGLSGMISQGAYQDYLGVTILSPSEFVSMRVWLRVAPSPTAVGYFVVEIYSPSDGSLGIAEVALSSITGTGYTQFIVNFPSAMPATIPTDTVLRIYTNTSSGSSEIGIKNLEIYPTSEPYLGSVVFGSNVADPEAFQGTTGFMEVNENDGLSVRTMFIIRDRLYMVKSRGGLYLTSDDATNEPSGWTIETISRRVGSETINGAGTAIGSVGEDWVFIVSREGLYIFWSTEPVKVSQEIQPTWDLINFDYLYTGWVTVDTLNRRVLVGVPMGSATSPSVILQMDFQQLENAEAIASAPAVSPTYTGQLKAHARSRKWTIWNIAASAGGEIENTTTGQAQVELGGSAGLYILDESAMTDDGAAINGYYTTNFYPTDEQKQQGLQSQGDRIFMGYLTCYMQGTGDFECELFGPGFVNSEVIPAPGAPAIALSNVASEDIETLTNFSAERIALKFKAQNSTTPQFSFQRADMYMAQDPVMTFRGYNGVLA
jgi:hypothetical protein